MAMQHLTKEDRDYYEAARHANSDGTTAGFFRTGPAPAGFYDRLNLPSDAIESVEEYAPARRA